MTHCIKIFVLESLDKKAYDFVNLYNLKGNSLLISIIFFKKNS